jgi:hypothetical protein
MSALVISGHAGKSAFDGGKPSRLSHGVAVAAAVWGKTWGVMANRPQYLALQGPGTDEEADQVANEGPASAADIYLNLRLDGVFQNLTNALCPGETQQ